MAVTTVRVIVEDSIGEETKFITLEEFAAVLKPHLDALDGDGDADSDADGDGDADGG